MHEQGYPPPADDATFRLSPLAGVAEHCAALKMKVCVADLARQEPLMKEIEPRLRQLGAQDVMFQDADVSKIESVQALHDFWDRESLSFGILAGLSG